MQGGRAYSRDDREDSMRLRGEVESPLICGGDLGKDISCKQFIEAIFGKEDR